MKKIKGVVLTVCFLLIANFAIAETYTGRAENIQTNDRGIVFVVVVEDSQGKEVLRRNQWVSTGVMTGLDAVAAVKNVVDRMTAEMWAHIEGAKIAMQYKTQIEAYTKNCDGFVEPEDRPSPQTERIE